MIDEAGQDLDLVARFLQTRENVHFERLVARHQQWIFRLCKRFLRSDDGARDATQEVFLRSFEKLYSFQGSNFAGWLKVIAVHTCVNIIEREKRWAPLEDEPEPAANADTEDHFVNAERLARARRAIERLPENQKLVFCMRYVDGCSYQEIETLTGFTGKEVKSFLQNARRNFELWCHG